MSNTKKTVSEQKTVITEDQKNTLIKRGLDPTLLDVFTDEELAELFDKSEKESLTMKLKTQRSNICLELAETFNEPIVILSKEELAEKIRILNQESFFTIKKDGTPFLLEKSLHAKAFLMVNNYSFRNHLQNKQTDACVTEHSKVVVSIGKWIARGKAIVNSEITKEGHGKYFNGYDLDYVMTVDGKNITFTKK